MPFAAICLTTLENRENLATAAAVDRKPSTLYSTYPLQLISQTLQQWPCLVAKVYTTSGRRTKSPNGLASATMSLINTWMTTTSLALARSNVEEAARRTLSISLTFQAPVNKAATRRRAHRLLPLGNLYSVQYPTLSSQRRRFH